MHRKYIYIYMKMSCKFVCFRLKAPAVAAMRRTGWLSLLGIRLDLRILCRLMTFPALYGSRYYWCGCSWVRLLGIFHTTAQQPPLHTERAWYGENISFEAAALTQYCSGWWQLKSLKAHTHKRASILKFVFIFQVLLPVFINTLEWHTFLSRVCCLMNSLVANNYVCVECVYGCRIF